MARYLCAVDVGTSSVRVGVMDDLGHLFSSAEHPIIMNRPSADQAEYDSEDIWSAICVATRAAMAQSGASGDDVPIAREHGPHQRLVPKAFQAVGVVGPAGDIEQHDVLDLVVLERGHRRGGWQGGNFHPANEERL